MRILIVEDNRNLASGLQHNLEMEGHVVELAYDGTSGLRRAREPDVDLIVLDLMIPKPDGYQILRTLRETGIETPVIVLTARGEEADKVRGFRLGADDYVTKPFGLLELLARVDAIRRRIRLGRGDGATRRLEEVVEFGDVRVDVATRTVLRGGEIVPLRPMEFELLMALARHEGEVVSRIDLLEEVWGYDSDVMSRTVDTHVRQLRAKLEHDPAAPAHLLTIRKAGYRLKLSP
jgi:DNA-binding response OmpR family regulator